MRSVNWLVDLLVRCGLFEHRCAAAQWQLKFRSCVRSAISKPKVATFWNVDGAKQQVPINTWTKRKPEILFTQPHPPNFDQLGSQLAFSSTDSLTHAVHHIGYYAELTGNPPVSDPPPPSCSAPSNLLPLPRCTGAHAIHFLSTWPEQQGSPWASRAASVMSHNLRRSFSTPLFLQSLCCQARNPKGSPTVANAE